MVDANRLPQVLTNSRADRLKRPIDASGVWLKVSRSNDIPELPVRRDELNEELAPVSTLAQTALTTAETKLGAAEVLSILNSALAEQFQEYPLVGGLEHRETDTTDNREYIYTVFPIQTRYAGTFELIALVSNDAAETLLDVEFGVYKEDGGRLILVFRDMLEGFANGVAKVKLIGIPSLDGLANGATAAQPIAITPNPVSVAAAVEMAVTFTGFDPANPYYSPRALFNGAEFFPVSDRLPGDIGVNNVIRFNSSVFAGQPLPGQLTIAVDNLVSAPVTINP